MTDSGERSAIFYYIVGAVQYEELKNIPTLYLPLTVPVHWTALYFVGDFYPMTNLPTILSGDGFKANGRPLIDNEIQLCRQFLRENFVPLKTKTRGSYGLKHVVENAVKTYISNGALIAAAILEGYKYEQDGINAHIYCRQKQKWETRRRSGFVWWLLTRKFKDSPAKDLQEDVKWDIEQGFDGVSYRDLRDRISSVPRDTSAALDALKEVYKLYRNR